MAEARYFLKLNDTDGFFEEVDKYTFDNSKHAISDSNRPRYVENCFVHIDENGNLSMQLAKCPVRDVAILQRGLGAIPPNVVTGGFIREPEVVKFAMRNGKKLVMREMKTGENWVKKLENIAGASASD